MKFLIWLGLLLVIAWAVLWLGLKIVSAAIHLLLLIGVAAVIWGAISRVRAGGGT